VDTSGGGGGAESVRKENIKAQQGFKGVGGVGKAHGELQFGGGIKKGKGKQRQGAGERDRLSVNTAKRHQETRDNPAGVPRGGYCSGGERKKGKKKIRQRERKFLKVTGKKNVP